MLGNVGQAQLSGRPLDFDELNEGPSAGPGLALPPMCLRSLQSPRPECGTNCPGIQPDGCCLADVVRAAQAEGVELTFEIDREGTWLPLTS